jgi:DNA-binding NtrC family response regulator
MHRLRRENDGIRQEISQLAGRRAIIGESEGLKRVLEQVAAVAPTRAAVLLEGESGTGKELLARALHEQSPRRNGPFVAVNCAALPEGLVESTLFGHERGAFTGATTRAQGAFERAHGGTLLLDEISEMRPDLQAKLLRAIQEQEFERVGGGQPVKVDVRIVATTNRNLVAEVEAGRFRRDLFFRLSVVPIHTPPLRERPDDIPLLVDHYVRLFAGQAGMRPPVVAPEALERLMKRRWLGNVRELANAVERAVILCRSGRLAPDSFGPDVFDTPASAAPASAPDAPAAAPAVLESTLKLKEIERWAIERALAATGGHRSRAADLLGISERTLRNKLNPGPPVPV